VYAAAVYFAAYSNNPNAHSTNNIKTKNDIRLNAITYLAVWRAIKKTIAFNLKLRSREYMFE
jgi:hypothetical protein